MFPWYAFPRKPLLVARLPQKLPMAPCARPTCSSPASKHCTACKQRSYCSKECQATDWPSHKQQCVATKKHKCFLLTTGPQSSDSSTSATADLLKPFDLQAYGHEGDEIRELRERLHWSQPYEVGKFYDHAGSEDWYYFVYGDLSHPTNNQRKNSLASRACGKDVFGDVVILRSGPDDAEYAEAFSKATLAKTLDWYEGQNSNSVFALREKRRLGKKMGMGNILGVPALHVE